MKQESESTDQDQILTVPEIIVPNFLPQIPEDLIENLSKREQHVLKALSIMDQREEWLMEVLVAQNKALRGIEKRHVRMEKWANFLSSRWTAFVGAAALIGPYVLPKVLTKLLGP